MKIKSKFRCFERKEAIEINRARIDHLRSLGLDIQNKTVIEFGAGPKGDFTSFLESQNCEVTITDARRKNVSEHLRRNPLRRGYVLDLNKETEPEKEFDVSFCYGVLYHTDKPEQALINFQKHCRQLLLLETQVHYQENDRINLYKEGRSRLFNQSHTGVGCRPSRRWIFEKLKSLFPHVYLTKTQPRHGDFPLRWPTDKRVCRSVFVASYTPILNDYLSETLLNRQVGME